MILSELDDRLSVVKRWGIMKTLQTQSVAEHCFNVQRICTRIAPWFGINDPLGLWRLSQGALHHDDMEAVTGDIPSTAKSYLQESERRIDVPDAVWYTDLGDDIKAIIKLADLLEAFHFLALEIRLGNRYVVEHKRGLKKKVSEYILQHKDWSPMVYNGCMDWMRRIESDNSKVYQ